MTYWVNYRHATLADIPAMLSLGMQMHAESRYRKFEFCVETAEDSLHGLIPQGLSFVAEHEGRIVGFFIGTVFQSNFGRDKFAIDILVYVVPEYRNGVGRGLIAMYIAACKTLRVSEIRLGVTTGIHPERTGRLYEHLGFKRAGELYVMEG